MGRTVRRRRHDRDDRGSIAMAMLIIMVGTMMAALLLPITQAQINTTSYDTRRNHAYDAAQSGLEVMINKIRNANDGSGNGKISALPCDDISGPVAPGGRQRYRASVRYFAKDPHGHEEWLDDPSKQVVCNSGTGAGVAPAFAVIVSVGTDNADGSFDTGTRTVQATYRIKIRNVNISGGPIRANWNQSLCLDALSSSPQVGSAIFLEPCVDDAGSQKWEFTNAYTMRLVASGDPAHGDNGLCITAAYPNSTGQVLTLQRCANTSTPSQQYAYGGNGNVTHMNSAGKSDRAFCWVSSGPNKDAYLSLDACQTTSGPAMCTARWCWGLDASVGPGGVTGSPFLVNYKYFGACMTLPYYSVDPSQNGWTPYLGLYPCGGSPDPDAQGLNSEWYFYTPSSGQASISTPFYSYLTLNAKGAPVARSTYTNGTLYCLISPLSSYGSPYTDKCNSVPAAQTNWTVYGDTGKYATSYRITDGAGRCLSAEFDYARLYMAPCNASVAQKWNAPPGILSGPTTDYHER